MITPAGHQQRQPVPQPSTPLGPLGEGAPTASFNELLGGPFRSPVGFMGDAPDAPGPTEEAEGVAANAQMFNEHGFFAQTLAPGSTVDDAPIARFEDPAPVTGQSDPAPGEQAPEWAPANASATPGVPPLSPYNCTQPPLLGASGYIVPTVSLAGDLAPPGSAPASPVPQEAGPAAPAQPLSAGVVGDRGKGAGPDVPAGAAPARAMPSPRQALTRTALNLSASLGTASVTVQAPGLSLQERERLEGRIAGELARHGLTIGRIILSAPAAAREQDKGEQ